MADETDATGVKVNNVANEKNKVKEIFANLVEEEEEQVSKKDEQNGHNNCAAQGGRCFWKG